MRTLDRGRFRLLLDYHRLPCGREASMVADGPNAVHHGLDVAEHYLAAQEIGAIPRDREAFGALLLNGRHRVIAFHVVSVGILNQAPIHPREVFRPAIAVGAHALVLAHHHPSGDPTPSHDDRRITDRLTEAGKLLGITVLDHVVLGAGRFYSFADGRTSPLPSIQRQVDRPGSPAPIDCDCSECR